MCKHVRRVHIFISRMTHSNINSGEVRRTCKVYVREDRRRLANIH